MIASLRGILLEKQEDGVVLETGGIGYFVAMCPASLFDLPAVGEEIQLWIVESVAMYGGGTSLYGFPRAEERRIFNVLREHVPGTGAKKALDLLDKAAKSLPDFRRCVLEKDAAGLVSMFGFSAKTAEKLVAGLQGKLEALPLGKFSGRGPSRLASAFEESLQGLIILGYRDAEAREAAQSARAVLGQEATSQQLIREALRRLSGRN